MRRVLLLLAALIVLANTATVACPTCYGAPDSQTTEAMNIAILSLLGITGGVLAGIVSFVVYLRRRAMKINRLFSHRLN